VGSRPHPGARADRSDAGYVLIWALFAFVVLSGIATAALKVTGAERRLAKASAGYNSTFYAAEAGLHAALQVMPDSILTVLIPGDSVEVGWRSLGGAAEYRAVFHRIDEGGHDLYLLRSTGRHQGLFGGTTTVSLTFTLAEEINGGVLSNRELTVSGVLTVGGECKVHANDWIYITGTLHSNGEVSSGGRVDGGVGGLTKQELYDLGLLGSSNRTLTDAAPGAPLAADPVAVDLSGGVDMVPEVSPYDQLEDVPLASPAELCEAADFNVRNGWVVSETRGDSAQVGVGAAAPWGEPQPREYELTGDAESGTYCIDGSLTVGGAVGLPTAPLESSFIADGYIDVTGTPFLSASHPEGVLLAAMGDVRLSGVKDGLAPNYSGNIFARSQCAVMGSVRLAGSLVCRGDSDPPGVQSIANGIEIVGDLDLIAQCGGGGVSAAARPLERRAWAFTR